MTLSWDTSKHSSYHSTLVIHVNESDSHVIPNIVGVLCKDNFRKLQQFAVMMFKDYKSRIITLKASPLSLELVHVDLTFLEKLRDNVKVVGKNFRNLVLEEVHTDVRFELKENDQGAHGGGDFMCSVGEQAREEDGRGKKRVAQLTPRYVQRHKTYYTMSITRGRCSFKCISYHFLINIVSSCTGGRQIGYLGLMVSEILPVSKVTITCICFKMRHVLY